MIMLTNFIFLISGNIRPHGLHQPTTIICYNLSISVFRFPGAILFWKIKIPELLQPNRFHDLIQEFAIHYVSKLWTGNMGRSENFLKLSACNVSLYMLGVLAYENKRLIIDAKFQSGIPSIFWETVARIVKTPKTQISESKMATSQPSWGGSEKF